MGDKLRCQLNGKLHVLSRGILVKSWQTRFCVFYVRPDGSSPQIHVFEKREHFDRPSKDKKVFNLEGLKKLQYSKEPFGFDVITKRDKFSFAAENGRDLRLWVRTLKVELNISTIYEADGTPASDEEESDSHLYMDDNIIYESADVTPMFSVVIDENEAAQRLELSGNYFLVVNLHNLALVDCTTKKAIYQWPFRYIRRFGKTRSNFQFEAGRKCPSGEGEFSFSTDQGFKIFEAFTKTTQKIKSLDEEPIPNELRTSGHSRAKSDGQSANQSNVLRTSGQHSPTPVLRGISEVHSVQSGHTDRRSVKSSGHVGHIQEKFASELNTVLKHHKDEQVQGSTPAPHHGEQLKHSGKKETEKTKSEKDKKLDKKAKKEKEMEEKAKEKQAKEKAKEKKSKKKKLEPSLSNPQPTSHTYEDVDDLSDLQPNAPGPEPLYAEATDKALKAAPKPKARKDKVPDLYSEPQTIKKDAWKQHGREEQDCKHQEDYDEIRLAARKDINQKDLTIEGRDEEPDETYDHLGNLGIKAKGNVEESIYGSASGKSISSIIREQEASSYEEAVPKSNIAKKGTQVDAYDEPTLCVQQDDEEESAYADIK